MIRTFGEHLRKEIRKDMDDLTDAISSGAASSYEEYTHYTGVIKGLAQAERLVLDLMEAAEKTSDEN
jgi:hypothetical protein